MKLKLRVCIVLFFCLNIILSVQNSYSQKINEPPFSQKTENEKTEVQLLQKQRQLQLQIESDQRKIVKLQTSLYVSLILLCIVSCSALFFLKNNKKKIMQLKSETEWSEKQRSPKKTDAAIPSRMKFVLQEETGAVKSVKEELVFKLSKTHPALTDKDHQLCTLLMLNLSSKEMASILNIQEESVEKSRSRLRKKMNLNSNQNFIEYFNSIK